MHSPDIRGTCQYPGEQHVIVHDSTSPQGQVLALDLQKGNGYCASHDGYYVAPISAPQETDTAS